jgi:hypothetical protein
VAELQAREREVSARAKRFAHDKTSGVPVTNFKRSTLLYLRAMS